MSDGHDEIDTQVAYLRIDVDDLKERVAKLETKFGIARIASLEMAIQVVIDRGLYQPEASEVLSRALKGEE